MRLKRVYIPDVLQGSTIVLRDGPYALSICANEGEGTLYVDTCVFYSTGLPLFQTVKWKIQDEYLDFYANNE